ncbi:MULTISPECIES: YihY/virulence factor BrkB family protein [Aerosakkonema]|uniref:YihY/virulence factor BrkB family protein n=1 Tax=Aerosakkonema TaxID=1246629 RepID=UPI0035B9E20D
MIFARFFRFFRHLNWATLKRTFQRAGQQRLPGLAAEMTYNAMLALFPSILALLTAIGLFDWLQSTFKYLAAQLGSIAPKEVLFLIKGFTNTISLSQNQGLFSLSFIIALWTASGALSAAMDALDRINQIPRKQRRPFWKAKLVSLGLTMGTILLLIVASFLVFISESIVQIVARQTGNLEPGLLSIWRLFSWPTALVIIASAIAFIYRFGPSRWTRGTPIMPGAILASVAWAIVSAAFRLYVSNFGNYNAAYGAVGAAIVLMLWLNLSCLVMLFGAQLNVSVGEAMRQRI